MHVTERVNWYTVKLLHLSRVIQSFSHGALRYYSGLGTTSKKCMETIDTKHRQILREAVLGAPQLRSNWIHLDPKYGGLGCKLSKNICTSAHASNSTSTIEALTKSLVKYQSYRSFTAPENEVSYFYHRCKDLIVQLIDKLNEHDIFLVHKDWLQNLQAINTQIPPKFKQVLVDEIDIIPIDVTIWTDALFDSSKSIAGGFALFCPSGSIMPEYTIQQSFSDMYSSTQSEMTMILYALLVTPMNSIVTVVTDNFNAANTMNKQWNHKENFDLVTMIKHLVGKKQFQIMFKHV
jgi:hypothetical protein